jgi:hypothetical protein
MWFPTVPAGLAQQKPQREVPIFSLLMSTVKNVGHRPNKDQLSASASIGRNGNHPAHEAD